MGSLLDDAAILNNQNSVGVDHGCEPMGNDNAGAAFRQCLERSLNRRFAFGIQRRGCLIQKQNWRVLENGARDCDALALAAGQGDAAFADRSVQAIGKSRMKPIAAAISAACSISASLAPGRA